MSNPSMNHIVQRTLYDLKQRWGNEISVYKLDSASTDYTTGNKSATKSVVDIRKAAVLPAQEIRRFFASIAFLTASKQFTSPGLHGFDQSRRGFIIEARDLPDGYEFQPEDWIVYRNRRYDVEIIERLEFDTGWMLIGKELKGSDPEQIINLNVSNALNFAEDVDES